MTTFQDLLDIAGTTRQTRDSADCLIKYMTDNNNEYYYKFDKGFVKNNKKKDIYESQVVLLFADTIGVTEVDLRITNINNVDKPAQQTIIDNPASTQQQIDDANTEIARLNRLIRDYNMFKNKCKERAFIEDTMFWFKNIRSI